jgi:hypothetical protein
MRTSASGAQVVGKSSEAAASPVKPRPPVATTASSSRPRWSGSVHELAVCKQKARTASPPTDPANLHPSTPGASPGLGLPELRLGVSPAAASANSLLSVFHRQWSSDRRWHVPCWLTSFVLHLLGVVVLGSITVPVRGQRTVMAILLSFGDLAAENEDGPVELATTMSLASTEVGTSLSHAEVEAVDDHPSPPAMQTVPPIIKPPPRDHSSEQHAEALAKAADGPPPVEPPGVSTVDQPIGSAHVIETTNKAHDEVVARFIEFDVGRLTGPEGLKARHDFDRLGTEALASLIRGLNKSAKMHASCPVVVISHKLGAMLNENPDPALLRYALENIGRDVPVDAPHLGHLQGLLTRLRQLHPWHSAPNVSMIVASLKSRDARTAIQAANVVTAECNKLADFEKSEVAWPLIQLLTHRDAELRGAAHDALVALAKGEDYGPSNDRRPAERIAAACRWSLELCPNRFEAAAESLLKTAEHLAQVGKDDAARRHYRRLVHEYAGTEAAAEAAGHLHQARNFALK